MISSSRRVVSWDLLNQADPEVASLWLWNTAQVVASDLIADSGALLGEITIVVEARALTDTGHARGDVRD